MPALDQVESLTTKNMLLKGARLKGTPWILGLAVYTGRDSKTALNQPKVWTDDGLLHAGLKLFTVP